MTRRGKYAFEESSTPKAFVVLDLWLVRTMNVSFLLLDPSIIAKITGEYLDWARMAGDSAWDTEITTDRAMTVESEIVRATDAMKHDSKILLRRVGLPYSRTYATYAGTLDQWPGRSGQWDNVSEVYQQREGHGSPSPRSKSLLILQTRPIMALPRVKVDDASIAVPCIRPFIT